MNRRTLRAAVGAVVGFAVVLLIGRYLQHESWVNASTAAVVTLVVLVVLGYLYGRRSGRESN